MFKHKIDSFAVGSGELERINEGIEQRGGDARHIISIVREEGAKGAKVGNHFYRVFYRVPLEVEGVPRGVPLDYEAEVERLRFEAQEGGMYGLPKPPKKPTERPKAPGPQSLPGYGCSILLFAFLALYIVGCL